MSGGYLGVSVFFTLSGFLITSLLLAEHAGHRLGRRPAFYTRRARRLLPASLVCLAAVCVLAAAGAFDGITKLRRDVLGALFQVFNWVKLASGESYADLTAAQAGLRRPLDHYWSLAIEEQFYWVWPLAFLGILWWCRRRGWTRCRPSGRWWRCSRSRRRSSPRCGVPTRRTGPRRPGSARSCSEPSSPAS